MSAIAPMLIFGSALVVCTLGLLHLLFTFYGSKLHPRDAELEARLKVVAPVITHETTMWKAWIGFNASHSFGAILFGAVYGYLAVAHRAFLLQSTYLLCVGLALLGGYVFLGKRYWFSVPYRSILVAAFLYALALAIHWVRCPPT